MVKKKLKNNGFAASISTNQSINHLNHESIYPFARLSCHCMYIHGQSVSMPYYPSMWTAIEAIRVTIITRNSQPDWGVG